MSQALEAAAIQACSVTKSYGEVKALDGIDLHVGDGEFFGLLGRNGSGKTTTLHILSTLIRPTRGEVTVAGFDVLTDPVQVRRAIGLVFQETSLDRTLSIEENLDFAGALYDLPPKLARQRSADLLALFELNDHRHTPVGKLSGGMRRAVDIIRGVLHRPRILLLDEPTVGLDLINRRAIWRFLADLRLQQGTSIVLTTHYLEESADCDRVAFMKLGRIIGLGRPAQMISGLGAYILELETDAPEACQARLGAQLGTPMHDGARLAFRVPDESFSIADLPEELRAEVNAVHLRRPDLNDVYLWMNRS